LLAIGLWPPLPFFIFCSPFCQAQSDPLVTVADWPVSRSAAIRILKRTHPALFQPANPSLPPPEIDQLLPAAAEALIAQRVVYEYLATQQLVASPTEIELELDQLKDTLGNQGVTIDQFLESEGITPLELRYEIDWKLSWNRHLRKTITEEHLEQHYLERRPRFDGSQIRVAHLFLPATDPASIMAAQARAAEWLRRLELPESHPDWLTWDQAVLQHSAAPTRTTGGEIGWIRYAEPMPLEFSRAAFQLAPGQLSPPVVSPFGVHLIKCLEYKPGKIGWKDAREEVQQDAAKTLFDRIHQQHRSLIQITPLTLFQFQ
jgi:hypothetical protein